MPRRRSASSLLVYLNGQLVGRLTRRASGAIEFQYNPGWLGNARAMPVSLSLPLREDRYIGDTVVAVFENLLPDDRSLRERLAARVGADGPDAYSLLSVIGRDCVGALQFLPEGVSPGKVGEIRGTPLKDADVARIVRSLHENPLGISLEEDEEFRISLAGVQEKTALLFHRGRWYRPKGTTATTHILKPPIGQRGDHLDLSQSVENEHVCLRLTAVLGLPTAESRIEDFGGKPVLVVKRFDRLWTKDHRLLRLPQEDCCQALGVPPARKYTSDGGPGIREILRLLQGSDDPRTDRRLFLKAQIVFWLLAAIDGHAKNFSLHLFPGGRFRLAPLYDVLSAQPLVDTGQLAGKQVKLVMPVGTNRHYVVDMILPRHFEQTATAAGMGAQEVREIMDELRETAAGALDRVLGEVSGEVRDSVGRSIAQGVRSRLEALRGAHR
ncbi:MAG: type II toxin-antitoxin system HipA family toxin [Nitrospirales bacterium]